MSTPQLPAETVVVPIASRAGVPDFLVQGGVALIGSAGISIVIPMIMQPGIGGIAVIFW